MADPSGTSASPGSHPWDPPGDPPGPPVDRPGRRRPRILVRHALLGLAWIAAVALLGILPSTSCTTGVVIGCGPNNQECGTDFVCQNEECRLGCTPGDEQCGPGWECRDPGDGQSQCLPIVCTDVGECPIDTTCWPPTGPSVCTPVLAVACGGPATAPACEIGTCPDGQLCRVIAVQAGEAIEEACGCVPVTGGE